MMTFLTKMTVWVSLVWLALGMVCCVSNGNPAQDAGPTGDAETWWYDCFEPDDTLCWRDQSLPQALSEQPTRWVSTPLLPMGSTVFDVADTQGNINEPPEPLVVDATWLGAEPLVPPHPWEDHGYLPATMVTFETTGGTLELAVALMAEELAFISAGEPLRLTFFHGLEVARSSDGVLLFALVDRADWQASSGSPAEARVITGAGLTFSEAPDVYCYGAEGMPTGNRQFAFSSLLVQGGTADYVLHPGATLEVSTTAGTYRAHHLAGWHRVYPGHCSSYADGNPWRLSYEIVLVD